VQVTEAEELRAISAHDPRTHRVEGTVHEGKIQTLRMRSRYEGHLVLHLAAEDRDNDGLVELPADGRSAVTITAGLTDEKGKPIKDRDVLVQFRVSRGTLSSRAVKSERGEASVELTPPVETTRAIITALAEGYRRADLALEIIPVDEYQALAKKPHAKGR